MKFRNTEVQIIIILLSEEIHLQDTCQTCEAVNWMTGSNAKASESGCQKEQYQMAQGMKRPWQPLHIYVADDTRLSVVYYP